MKTLWLIQSTGLLVAQPHANVEYLKKLNFEFKDFGVIPFTSEITNLENILVEDVNFIIRGGTKLLILLNSIKHISELSPHLTKEQLDNSDYFISKLKAGIFYDIEKFDQEFYSTLNLPLLNSNAQLIPMEDVFKLSFDRDMFIKPSRDLKAFNGGIIPTGLSVESFIKSGQYQSFYKDEMIVLSEVKEIYSEYRFFVVNKEVVGGSQYRKGNRPYLNGDIASEVLQIASEYALLYQPNNIFTMDIALTPDGYKIIEYNCWNASGLYHCNGQKVFFAVNEFIKNQNV